LFDQQDETLSFTVALKNGIISAENFFCSKNKKIKIRIGISKCIDSVWNPPLPSCNLTEKDKNFETETGAETVTETESQSTFLDEQVN
jgi:hypothetical protein